ncbi:DUF4258 domain-containing protein [Candidatus Micrarchaeota archaeon]|nr:DUF4258 domain-containing protein [Candidatus Micrarchaeota archaeon]
MARQAVDFQQAYFGEITNDNVSTHKVISALENGTETDEKRKKGVFEFVRAFKNEVIKVVVADEYDHWVVITVIKFKR